MVDLFQDRTQYAVTDVNAILKSANWGVTCVAANSGLPSLSIMALTEGLSSSNLYAGTAGSGFVERTPSGASWLSGVSPQAVNPFVLSLAVDAITTSNVYAGTRGQGILKSADGGTTWTPVDTGLGNMFVLSLAVGPVSPQNVYAGTAGGVFLSNNGGQSWAPLTGGLWNGTVTSLLVDPLNHTHIYAGTEGGGVFLCITNAQ
jgi:photosystem II stability/assembly factor-like uncharacterized protein